MDVEFRKLVAHHCGPSWRLRLVYSIAPHPSRVHARASACAEQAGVKLWSRSCLEQRWKLASYIANRSDNRWLKCALAWPAGRRTRIGRPTNTWDAQIQIYCRWQKIGRMEGHRNANRFLADTYGLLYSIFDTEVVRVEISFGFCCFPAPYRGSLRAGRFDSTRLDWICNISLPRQRKSST